MTTKTHTLRTLAVSTALAGSLFAFAGTAAAQNTPDAPSVVLGNNVGFTAGSNPAIIGNTGDGPLAIDGTATTLTVDLAANNATIINWNGFNVANGSMTTFTSQLASPVAVLNRVTGGGASNLSGTLTSGGNVNVFLLNPNGILIGGTGAITTGSFVASTLDVSDADFLTNSYGFTGAAGATAGIEVQTGAVIGTTGGNRGLVLVAPKIVSNGALSAGTQDVAFVTATDTRLTFNPGSPLSITINRGTAVPGASQVIGNTVAGQNVYFALASQAGINDALLQVGASVTTAVASDRGIVLIAGQSAADPNVQVASSADTSGVASLRTTSLTSNAAGSTIFGRATGTLDAAALTAGGSVSLGAVGATTVTGTVTAGTDYIVSGSSVALSGTQQAAGAVSVTGGTITNPAALTLVSNSDGVGAEALTLNGAVTLGTNSRLDGGTARQSDVIVNTALANGLTLGTVNANLLTIASGGRLTGAIQTGDVTTTGALALLSSANITTGALTVGSATLDAMDSTVSTGAVNSGGTFRADGRRIDFTTIDAAGVTLNANDTAGTGIGGTRITSTAGVTLDATTGTGGIGIGMVDANGGALTATSVGDIVFGSANASGTTSLVTQNAPADIRITGALTGTGAVSLTSTRDVAAGSIGSSAGTVTIGASGGTVTGIGVGAVDLSANGALLVTAGTLARLGALSGASVTVTGDTISATSVSSPGVVSLIADNGALNVAGTIGGTAITLDSTAQTQLGGAVTGTGAVFVRGTTGVGFTTIGGATTTIASSGGAVVGTGASATGQLDINGDSVTLATANSTNGAVQIVADTATLSVGTVLSGGTGTLQATGDLLVDSATASNGALVATSGAAIRGVSPGTRASFGGSGTTQVLATGSASLGTVGSSGGSVEVRGSTVNALGVSAATSMIVAASAGGTTLGSLSTTSGDAAVSATGATAITGPVAIGGNHVVSGQSVVLSGTQGATGAVSVTANGGAITNPAALTLTANSDGIGADGLTLNGIVTLGANSVLNGGPARQTDVFINTATTNGLTLGTVNAFSLSIAGGAPLGGAITTGDLNLAGTVALRANANITTGAIAASSALVQANGAAVSVGPVTTTGAFTASGSRIDFTTIDAGSADLAANDANGTGIGGTRITSGGAINLAANSGTGGIAIGTLNATGALTGTSVGTITLGTVGVGGTTTLTTQTNPAKIVITGGLTGTGAVTLTSTSDVEASTISSTGGALTINALSGMVTGLSGGRVDLGANGPLLMRAGSLARLGVLTAQSIDVAATRIEATSATTTPSPPSSGPISLVAGNGGLDVTSTVTGGSLILRSTGVTGLGGAVTGSGAVDVRGTTSVGFSTISGGSTSIAGGAVNGGSASGTSGLTVTGGDITVTTLAAANGAANVTATGGTLTFGSASGRSVGLTQTGAGSISGTSVTSSAGALSVTSDGAMALGTVTGTGGATTLRTLAGSSDITIGTSVGGTGPVTLSATGSVRAPLLGSAGALTVTAQNDVTGLSGGRVALNAGGALGVTAGGFASLGTVSGATVTVGANRILATSVTASGNIGMTAGAGGLRIDQTTTGADITISSTGTTSLGGAVSGATVQVSGTTSVDFTTIGGSNTTTITGGGVSGGGASGTNGLTVSGGAINIGSLSASNGALSVTASGGSLTFGTATARSATLTHTGAGTLDGGTLTTTAGGLNATSQGTMTFGTVDVTGGTSLLTTQGAPADIVITTGLSGSGNVTLTSTRDVRATALTSRAGSLFVNATAGRVVGFDTGADTARAALSAANLVQVRAGSLARLGAVGGGTIDVEAANILATSVVTTPASGAIRLAATGGNLTVDSVVTGGALTLSSTGAISLGDTVTGGGIVISGTNSVGFTTVNGGTTSITGGAVSGGTATGTSGLTIGGSSINVGTASSSAGGVTLNAGGALTITTLASAQTGLTATAGGPLSIDTATVAAGDATLSSGTDATLRTASVSGNLGLTAAGAATLADGIAVGGNYRIRAGSVALGVDPGSEMQSAGGLIDITATSGGIAGGAGLALATTGGTTSTIVLDAAQGIAFGSGSITAGGTGNAAIGLRAGSGQAIDLGAAVRGASIVSVSAAPARTFATQLTHNGNFTAGQVDTNVLNINLTAGGIQTGAITTVTTTTLATAGTGGITTAAIRAGGATTLTSAGSGAINVALIGAAGSTGAVSLTGGTAAITVGPVFGSTIGASSGGNIATGALTSSGATSLTTTGSGTISTGAIRAGGATTLSSASGAITTASIGAVGSTGAVSLTSGSGAITTGPVFGGTITGATAGNIAATDTLTSTGATSLTTTGSGTITTAAIRATGPTSLTSVSGAITAASIGTTGSTGAVSLTSGSGAITTGPVFGGTITGSTAGNITATDTLTSTGATSLTTTGSGAINTAAIRAGGATTLTSASGAITAASIGATGSSGAVSLNSGTGAIGIGPVFGGTITGSTAGSIAATGTLTSTGATTLTTTGTGTITTAAIAAGGAAQLTAASGAIATGTISASTVTATAGGSVSVGATTATAATPTATTIALISTGGNVTASGALTATGSTAITAGGTASLQAVTAGPAITITAADAALNGAVQATAVTLTNGAPGAGTRLGGDGTTAGGFRLSQAEINLIATPTLTLNGQSGAVTVESLALNTAAGSSAFNVFTTGDINVTGTVSSPATTAARTIRFGGTASGTTGAQSIRVIAASAGGGRLLFDGATLDLRGQRIAVGTASLIAALFPASGALSGTQVADQFVSNPNSALYNALVGGGSFTNPTSAPLLTATRLSVTYDNFAVVQNTAPSGLNLGTVLGGSAASPVTSALTLRGPGTTIPNSFALFGTINGIGASAASVLGSAVIGTTGIDIPSSRINGCIIGSGAGCLTTTVAQPTLNVFDPSRLDIFSTADDFTLPFDPVVGSNNEALFAGIAAIDTPPPPECEAGADGAACPAPEENKQ